MNSQQFSSLPSPPKISSLSGIGDLLRRTWQIYKERILVFLGIMIWPGLVSLLFFGLSLGAAIITRGQALFIWELPFFIFALLLFFIIFIIIGLWAGVSLLYAIKEREEKIGIKKAFAKGWHKIISYFWISLLAGFITLGGFVLLIIPGIIFLVWFALSAYVLVAEDLKGMNALFRSKQLVSGYWWSVFWRLLVIGAIALVVYLSLRSLYSLIVPPPYYPVLNTVADSIFGIFWAPFIATYTFLIYEDLRKVKAGVVFEPPKKETKIIFYLIGIIGFLLLAVLFLAPLIRFFLLPEFPPLLLPEELPYPSP